MFLSSKKYFWSSSLASAGNGGEIISGPLGGHGRGEWTKPAWWKERKLCRPGCYSGSESWFVEFETNNINKNNNNKKNLVFCHILNSHFHGFYEQAVAMECKHINVKFKWLGLSSCCSVQCRMLLNTNRALIKWQKQSIKIFLKWLKHYLQ